MKVFISHKNEDEHHARDVFRILEKNGIDAYLDSMDREFRTQDKARLREYIIEQMERCTHLIPVVTEKTEKSWWVPFEIGVGTEKGRAIATYCPVFVMVPEILQGWPYLRSVKDMELYARRAVNERSLFREDYEKKSSPERRNVATSFERQLRRELGQL